MIQVKEAFDHGGHVQFRLDLAYLSHGGVVVVMGCAWCRL